MKLSDALGGGTAPAESRRIPGVVTAIVTNNHDPESLGRIRLTFPWLSDRGETDWVRIATLMAGDGRGSFFLPEVGDEVLVAFEHGDVDHPYVLGALWSAEDRPPHANKDGRNDTRVLESRNGHRLVFEDGNTDQIRIETKGGHSIVLDDSDGSEGFELTTEGGHTITLSDADGILRLRDRSGNTIEGTGGYLRVDGRGTITIRARTVRIEGSAVEIEADGVLTLRGGVVRIN